MPAAGAVEGSGVKPAQRRRGALTALALATSFIAGGAGAQSIERNLPPPPVAAPPALAAPPPLSAEADATPLGPNLRGVMLLGAQAAVRDPAGFVGLHLGGPAAEPGASPHARPRPADLRARLAPLLGRPLSRQLIARVQTQVIAAYRAAGFPFLSVTTPEQEISGGVLQVRVVEYHAETVRAPGATASDAAYVESRLRLRPGAPVSLPTLSQDLDWLDRYPFRAVQPVFSPGTTLGGTVLSLQTRTVRPISIYAGYANSGSPLTGSDRYFAGMQAGVPLLRDAVFSYQFTASGDALFDRQRPFSSADNPRYLSHGGRLVIPTFPRQDVEVQLNAVTTNQPIEAFVARQTIVEASVAYRSALSNLWGPLRGEIALGVDATRQNSQTLFGDEAVFKANADVFHAVVSYALQESDHFGQGGLDARLHLSPGGVDDHNSAEALLLVSRGRVSSSRYGFLTVDVSRSTTLPAAWRLKGWSLSTAATLQYAPRPLPLVDSTGLGGESLVRAYTLDDGAFDSAAVVRSELHPPALPAPAWSRGWVDRIASYLALDAGYGRDNAAKTSATAASVGVGVDLVAAGRVSLRAEQAWALTDAGRTRRGDGRLNIRLTASF